MSDNQLDLWLKELRNAYRSYKRPENAIGMTSSNELCFVESYARDIFSGAGRIVDLGCWYGATTVALARGLQANSRAKEHRLIEAFDMFIWGKWMDSQVESSRLPKRYQTGECFFEDVRELLRPYSDITRVEKQDLLNYRPGNTPVEFLFVDAMKSWSLAQAITDNFYPLLIPGVSLVVQQDFVWHHPIIATAHLTMWHLREHFQFLHHVPRSCSVVFRCIKPIEAAALPRYTPDFFTLDMIHEAYDYSYTCVEPERLNHLKAAKLCFLLEQQYYDVALNQARELFDANPGPNAPIIAGVQKVVQSLRQTVGNQPAQAVESSRVEVLKAIEEMLPTPSTPISP